MNYRTAAFPSSERRGGRAIKKKNPFRYGTAGVVAHKSRRRMRFEAWCVSDHPVCASKVASQHFLNGAATPPQRGGEYPGQFIHTFFSPRSVNFREPRGNAG